MGAETAPLKLGRKKMRQHFLASLSPIQKHLVVAEIENCGERRALESVRRPVPTCSAQL